jgi:HD superfamily phosphohydrolase
MNRKKLVSILLASALSFLAHAQIVDTIFGKIDEKNPVTLKLLNHNVVQRLKHIDQSGPLIYISNEYPHYSRYDHSLGVYALLKRYNVSTEEQIAGIMHDTSHTVFSHLADYILQPQADHTESYQDNIHDVYLSKAGLPDVLKPYNLTLEDISPKNPKFTALEQPYPDMNADRIEYNLHTALLFNDLQTSDVQQILNALHYKNKKWFFTDPVQAKKFAKLSTYYTRTFWGNSKSAAQYSITGAMLKYALKNNIITLEEFQTGTDLAVVHKLKNSKDHIVQKLLNILLNVEQHYIVANSQNFDIHHAVKMRGIDPLVSVNNKLKRLSTISVDFRQDLQSTAEFSKHGVYLKFVNIRDPKILELLRSEQT